jgi:hypothetical protein
MYYKTGHITEIQLTIQRQLLCPQDIHRLNYDFLNGVAVSHANCIGVLAALEHMFLLAQVSCFIMIQVNHNTVFRVQHREFYIAIAEEWE